MRKVKLLNPMALVYLLFAVLIIIFHFTVDTLNGNRVGEFWFSIFCPVLSAVALFVLEGFYYPMITNKKYLGIFRKSNSAENEKRINRTNTISNILDDILWLLFLILLLATAANKDSLLWIITTFAWLFIAPYSFKMVRNNLRAIRHREVQKTSAQYLLELGINREGVENCIEITYRQEQRTIRRQLNLVASFFPLTLVFIILYYFNVKAENAEFLVIQYCIYMALIIIGYIWHSNMGKRLNEFWEVKKSFINIINVVEE